MQLTIVQIILLSDIKSLNFLRIAKYSVVVVAGSNDFTQLRTLEMT